MTEEKKPVKRKRGRPPKVKEIKKLNKYGEKVEKLFDASGQLIKNEDLEGNNFRKSFFCPSGTGLIKSSI